MHECKECWKSRVRKNRAARIEHYRDYDKRRTRRPDRIAARAEYERTNPEPVRRAKAAWSERNRQKRQAQIAVSNAVRDGRLTKEPCVVCGSEEQIHGHHEDYSRPLDVIWLFPRHHSEYHVVRREAEKLSRASA